MMKDRKDPRIGEKQDPMANQDENGSEAVAGNESVAQDVNTRSVTDRRIEGLLRIIGLQDGNDRELTEAEAELIFDIAEAEPVSKEQLARIREGVLRRRFGTTPVPAENPTEAIASSAASYASNAQFDGSKPVPDVATTRPSLINHCRSLKRRLADVATELRLDRQTLFELDRGVAHSVPLALIESAATALGLARHEVARCLAPADEDVARMAAHGRPGAEASKPAQRRGFLEVIEGSRLPEAEKDYWRQIVANQSAASASVPEKP
jgi:hypothetical protein